MTPNHPHLAAFHDQQRNNSDLLAAARTAEPLTPDQIAAARKPRVERRWMKLSDIRDTHLLFKVPVFALPELPRIIEWSQPHDIQDWSCKP